MTYTKKQAIQTVVKCAHEYKTKLANTRLLIIYRDKEDNIIKSLEIVFRPSNFQHLTGLLLLDKNNNIKENCSIEFYHKCTKKPSLKESEILFKEDGTTPLKLYALPYLIDISKITKICGNYNHTKPNLEADAVVGSINFLLGISKTNSKNTNEYFPRTAMLEDIRKVTENPSQVLAIFQKVLKSQDKYTTIKYVAKGLNLNNINFPESIKKIISLEDYISPTL